MIEDNSSRPNRYTISDFYTISENSIICFPRYVIGDGRQDNFSYVAVHGRDMKIDRFIILGEQALVPIFPSSVDRGIFLGSEFKAGDLAPVSVYDHTRNQIFLASPENLMDVIARLDEEQRETYGAYYLGKIFSENLSAIEVAKSKVANTTKFWSYAETRFNQRRNRFWDQIAEAATLPHPPASYSLEHYLSEFRNGAALRDWLEENAEQGAAATRTKWATLFEYAESRHLVKGEEANNLASSFLYNELISSPQFRKVFAVVSSSYFSGQMGDLQEYLIDEIDSLKKYYEGRSFETISSTFTTLQIFVRKSSQYLASTGSVEVIRMAERLLLHPKPSRFFEIDPYHTDLIVSSIIPLIADAKDYTGLALKIFAFCYRYIESEAQNEDSANLLRSKLLAHFSVFIAPKLAAGVVFPELRSREKFRDWIERSEDIHPEARVSE